jgi:hypothetical protein
MRSPCWNCQLSTPVSPVSCSHCQLSTWRALVSWRDTLEPCRFAYLNWYHLPAHSPCLDWCHKDTASLLLGLWWYSERFVVITMQLQAAKCSLSSQLLVTYSLYWKICDLPTLVLNVNKRLLDWCALHRVHASIIFCLISVSDHLAA